MQYLTTAEEAKCIDNISINKIGIPSLVLMEKAALSVYTNITNIFGSPDEAGKILAVCSVGNNGGDGIAVARLLKESGYDAYIMMIGNGGTRLYSGSFHGSHRFSRLPHLHLHT